MNLSKNLVEIIRYFKINDLKGIPYLKELQRLNSLKDVAFEKLVFPYEFVDEVEEVTEIHRDEGAYPHIIKDDWKIFFPRNWSDDTVKFACKLLSLEQHQSSPHFYQPINEGSDITLDIGSAEANFTIDNFTNSKTFHLFDTEEFLEPLHKTFEIHNNVVIHTGLIGLNNPIDSITFDGKVDNIKIDVEGTEYEVLVSATNTILRDKPFIQVCTYHKKESFEEVYDLLKSFGYKSIKCSDGYMIFPNSFQEPPYFRKGVLYARY